MNKKESPWNVAANVIQTVSPVRQTCTWIILQNIIQHNIKYKIIWQHPYRKSILETFARCMRLLTRPAGHNFYGQLKQKAGVATYFKIKLNQLSVGRKKFLRPTTLKYFACYDIFYVPSAVSPALQQPLLKLMQGSWYSCSSLWRSPFETRALRPATIGVIVINFPSFKSPHKQPLQLAPFKPNCSRVMDKILQSTETDPCSRVLQKLMAQGVKKFAAFHGTGTFMTLVTTARHLPVRWATPVQSKSCSATSWGSILLQRATKVSWPVSKVQNKTRCELHNVPNSENLFEIRWTTFNAQLTMCSILPSTAISSKWAVSCKFPYANSHAVPYSRTCHITHLTTGEQCKLSESFLRKIPPAT